MLSPVPHVISLIDSVVHVDRGQINYNMQAVLVVVQRPKPNSLRGLYLLIKSINRGRCTSVMRNPAS
jgi:hypothetical protein